MDCEAYSELMSAALDGECSPDQRRALDSHLAACPRCSALFQMLASQSAALRELDCQPPADLTRRIMASLPEQKKPGKVIHWKRWGSLAACLVLVAAAAIALPRSMQRSADLRLNAAPEAAFLQDFSGGALPAPSEAPVEEAPMPVPNAVLDQAPQHYSFESPQAIRVTYGQTPVAPSALIIGSVEELEDYLAQFGQTSVPELNALAETYTEEFFEERRLLCVVVESGSGSNRYEIAPQGLLRESVTVLETVPEVGTCDMAAWLLTAEVDTMFHGGQTLAVNVSR